MNNKFGTRESDFVQVIKVFENYKEIQKVSIYGSRARGNFKNGSDIDLVLYGNNIDHKIISEIKYKLENDNFIPLMFDINHYEDISNNDLKNNIDKESKIIYTAIYSHPDKLLKDHLRGVIHGTQIKSENKLAENKLAELAAFFHDLGKINPNFQKKLFNKLPPNTYSQHAFLSAYIFHCFYYENADFIDELIDNREERITILKALIAKHHGDLPNLNKNFINNAKEDKYNPFKKLEKFILENDELKAFDLIDKSKELIGFESIEKTSIKSEIWLESFKLDYCSLSTEDLECIQDKLDLFLETQFAFGLLLDSDKRDASGNNLDINEKKKEQEKFHQNYINKLENKFRGLNVNNGLNILRTEMREKSVQELQKQLAYNPNQRIFTLTAPTGAGKTYMLLALASELLKKDSQLGIIYALPFLSITEQVEKVCQEIFGTEFIARIDSKSINSNINKIQQELDSEQNQEILNKLIKEKYNEETFEKPFIITTFVQFFETLLSNQNSQCMKLPNFANRVFLIDEIQSLPPNLYTFFVAYLKTFCEKFNSYAIVSTATMPDFQIVNENTEAKKLFQTFNNTKIKETELLGEKYFENNLFNRYEINSLGECQVEFLAEHIKSQTNSCLIILNTIGDSEKLWDILKQEKNIKVILLNTRFMPEDRKDKVEFCKELLKNKEKVILISTQLIEAGVDISFPIVYRDLCPLPSLIQAAGRCNRNNDYPESGQVYFLTLLAENGKVRAKLIYRDPSEKAYLRWTEELLQSKFLETFSIHEQELFKKQKKYFESIAINRKCGEYNKFNLVKGISELAFEDVGKFKLIDREMGEEYKFYIPHTVEKGKEKYQEVQEQLVKLSETKKDFQARKFIKIQLDKLKSEIENRTVSFRLNRNKQDLPEAFNKDPLMGIYWLYDLNKYKSHEKGLILEISIEERIL